MTICQSRLLPAFVFAISGVLHAQETVPAAMSSLDADRDGVDDASHLMTPVSEPRGPAVDDTCSVVHWIPSPGTNPQGLAWHGGYLWCSDVVSHRIYKVDPVTGATLGEIPDPATLCEGLEWADTSLWVCGWNTSPTHDCTLFELDTASGTVRRSFPTPGGNNRWAHGMTWDGECLWVNDFTLKQLIRVRYADGAPVHAIPSPGDSSIGLAWDGNYLWSGDFGKKRIYKIHPLTGDTLRSIRSPMPNPRDMTWDGRYLWVSSREDRRIYQLDVGTTDVEGDDALPASCTLHQNYPNPFNPTTSIAYRMERASDVRLSVHDLLGREVALLVDERKEPGTHVVEFNAAGHSSGIYVYRLRAGSFVQARMMIVLR